MNNECLPRGPMERVFSSPLVGLWSVIITFIASNAIALNVGKATEQVAGIPSLSQLNFSWSEESAREVAGVLKGAISLVQLQLQWDFVLILGYAILMTFILVSSKPEGEGGWRAFSYLGLFAGGFDALENATSFAMLSGIFSSLIVKGAFFCALAKWSFLAVGFVIILYRAVIMRKCEVRISKMENSSET